LAELLAKGGADSVSAMMRITHGLKGSAATLGLDALAALAHQLENDNTLSGEHAAALIRQIDAQLARATEQFRPHL
jgi:HPt (histidine-containing phosphotransfer) domain-containing protein